MNKTMAKKALSLILFGLMLTAHQCLAQQSSSCGSCQTSQFKSKKSWGNWFSLGGNFHARLAYFYCNEGSSKANQRPHYWYFEIQNRNSDSRKVSYAVYSPSDSKPRWYSTTIPAGGSKEGYESTWSECQSTVRVHVK
jgi:hypothetical protein